MGLLSGAQTQLMRAQYQAASTAKVSWFSAFYILGRHIVGPLTAPGEVPRPMRSAAPPMADMRREFGHLFTDEWRDVEAGTYKMPKEFRTRPNPLQSISNARAYIKEAQAVSRRATRQGGGTEVRDISGDSFPNYYRQNFHFQTDGWLSDKSAQVYDTQVEVLFTGAAAAMRRRALSLIAPEIRRMMSEGRSEESIQLADVACGTGPLLHDVVDNFPKLSLTGVDLSAPYLAEAKKMAGSAENARFVVAPAEHLPFEDNSVDILMTVYLYHELPPKVRREVAAETARVLRPGGLYVHLDSVQYGDTSMDVLLESFPRAFHEPYYDSYCGEDLKALFADVGLAQETEKLGFLSKAGAYRKAG
ncbi:MAG: class I SAM-dependent methyltransferase [Pseudomonadota bacterium]